MDNPEPVALSVVICTYNRADLLLFCLKALSHQTLTPGLFEILVVDNNSTDNTRLVTEDFSEKQFPVRYILEMKQGPNHARNRGIREAKGKYIACLDDDARAAPDWLKRIYETFETTKPQPLAIGGKIIPWYETAPPAWFTDDFEIRSYGDKTGFLNTKKARYGFASGNIALPKIVLEEYKGFGEDFGIINGKFKVGEDSDLFHRIWKNNLTHADSIFWYDPAILVEHWTPARNWQFTYRLKRSHSAGEALAQIENATFFSGKALQKMAFLLLQPFYLASNLFNRPLKNNWLRFLQNIYLSVGYLTESLRKK